MLGIVSHSVVPIRMAALIGFMTGFLSIMVALVFLILKLVLWDAFPMGIAPIVIGMFFMFGVVVLFIGILGEYCASIPHLCAQSSGSGRKNGSISTLRLLQIAPQTTKHALTSAPRALLFDLSGTSKGTSQKALNPHDCAIFTPTWHFTTAPTPPMARTRYRTA
ncbi:MAG: hypothetical protein R3F37_14720 [Candidatus Competibacteraceae bacterium]